MGQQFFLSNGIQKESIRIDVGVTLTFDTSLLTVQFMVPFCFDIQEFPNL